jgi:hypothetical protein
MDQCIHELKIATFSSSLIAHKKPTSILLPKPPNTLLLLGIVQPVGKAPDLRCTVSRLQAVCCVIREPSQSGEHDYLVISLPHRLQYGE